MSNQSNSKQEAYIDRNLAVMALAKLAKQQGYNVGVQQDPNEPDWPVIMIDLPTGQVGWHIPKKELLGDWPDYTDLWDGHSVQQKQQRVKKFIDSQ
jgi:hypothetical protein